MVTMKDVAKHAGVSVSTVSNIVNQVKSVNSEIVKRVEFSMKELGFVPNAKAQSLRSKKSNIIGVIFPDISDIYSRIFEGIQDVFRKTDFKIEIYTTGDILELEVDAFNKLKKQQCELYFVASCAKSDFSHINSIINDETNLIFVRRKPKGFDNFTFISIDEYSAVYNAVSELSANNIKSCSLLTLSTDFSNELSCTKAFNDACDDFDMDKVSVIATDMGKEKAFRTAAWWFFEGKIPEVIITTNQKLYKGIVSALNFFEISPKPQVLTINSFSWTQTLENPSWLDLDFYSLGSNAARKALELLDGKSTISKNIVLSGNNSVISSSSSIKINKSSEKTIKILLSEGVSAYALGVLAKKYNQDFNTKIEISTMTIDNIFEILQEDFNNFDIVQIHKSWLDMLTIDEKIMQLDNTTLSNDLKNHFNEDILQVHSKFRDNLYAVPYIADHQILFLRTDIFSSMHLKRLFYELHKKDLDIPKTFEEYTQICEFLSNNTHINDNFYSNSLCFDDTSLVYNFIPRLWNFANKISNNYSEFTEKDIENALLSLEKSLHFANPNSSKMSLSECVSNFNDGNSAMLIVNQMAYIDYIHSILSPELSQFINVCSIPGKYSIQNGISLAINNNSDCKKECISFLRWFISSEVSIANNILGGSLPSKYPLELTELSILHPCLKFSQENIKNTFELTQNGKCSYKFTKKLAKILSNFLENNLSLKKCTSDIFEFFKES